jgi:hypothetical protein
MSGGAADFRDAIAELREAAWREGIEPEGPLGVFIRALETILGKLGDIVAGQDAQLTAMNDAATKVIEAEVEKLRSMGTLVDGQVRRAEAAIRHLEISTAELETKTVASLAGSVSEKLKTVLVIRERRHNRRVLWGTALFMMTLAAGLFGGGFGWRAYLDRQAVEGLDKCLRAAVPDQNGRNWYCPLAIFRNSSE